MTRAGVAWFAVGCGRDAYEHALRYATQRLQWLATAATEFGDRCGWRHIVMQRPTTLHPHSDQSFTER